MTSSNQKDLPILRRLEIDDRLKANIEAQPCALGKLKEILIWTYLNNSWVSDHDLFELAGIEPRDPLLQKLVDAGIGISKKDSGVSCMYQMQSNPMLVHWDSYLIRATKEAPLEPKEIPAPARKPFRAVAPGELGI